MKALLDTSALNWLTDHPDELAVVVSARDEGLVDIVVTPEAAKEIRDTRSPDRLAALEATLSRFFPLTPTRVPRLGAIRLGLGRVSTEGDMSRLGALGFLKGGQDRNLTANAGGYRCDVFVARDYEMSREKRDELERVLEGTRVIEPEVFVAEVRALRVARGASP